MSAYIYVREIKKIEPVNELFQVNNQLMLCEKVCADEGLDVKKILRHSDSDKNCSDEILTMIKKDMKKGDFLIACSIIQLTPSEREFHVIVDALERKKCFLLTPYDKIDFRTESKTTAGIFAWAAMWFMGLNKIKRDEEPDEE